MGKRLIASLMVLGAFAVNATAHELPIFPMDCFPPPPPDYRQHPPMPPPDHHCIAPKMQFSTAQQAQVDQILEKEHDYTAGLIEKQRKSQRTLRQAVDREPFDEAAVSTLVKQQADLEAELMLSHIRTGVRIKTLFLPAHPN